MDPATEQLHYSNPAVFWEEALPLGNGRLGAMVYGGVRKERIALNEDTLWNGGPDFEFNPEFKEVLPRVRDFLRQRKFFEANQLLSARMGDHDNVSYLPAGDLLLTFDHGEGPVLDYRRDLDLESALAGVNYVAGEVRYTRSMLASFPDQVIVVRLMASAPGALNFSFSFQTPLEGETFSEGTDAVCTGTAPWKSRYGLIRWRNEKGLSGMGMAMRARVIAQGGQISASGGTTRVGGADSAVLLIAVRTGFRDYRTEPERDCRIISLRAKADLDAAEARGYEAILDAHLADYSALYRRSSMDLGADKEDLLPTDLRICKAGDHKHFSPALAALLYHYSRYLLIACSRPGTQPANLQGIWNRHLDPPWASNYTTNINTEMNYWGVECSNLTECFEPLERFLFELSEKGALCAEKLFGLPGWCSHHNSDVWRFCTAASVHGSWLYFPLAGGWLCRHLAEHYRYSGDREFLHRVWPVLTGCAEFLLGLLVKDEFGQWTTSPSTSPENSFQDPVTDTPVGVATGSAVDLTIIRELLESILELAPDLDADKASGRDALCARIHEVLPELKEPAIGKHGELLEFGEDFEETDVHHRHVSHLYGVYPGCEFNKDRAPEYFQASKVSLKRRGDRSTGWAMGWRVALWARFGNGNHAEKVIRNLLTPAELKEVIQTSQGGGVYPNLFDAHPPFQIDGNFGVAAGIVEMLLQSHLRTAEGAWIIDLLPALPKHWKKGSVTGLRTRGGLTVDLSWNGRHVRIKATADRNGSFLFRNGKHRVQRTLAAGESVVLER